MVGVTGLERLKLGLSKDQSNVIDLDEVDNLLLLIATKQKQYLYQKLVRELPQKLKGLSVAEMRVKTKEVFNEVCRTMQKEVDQWN